MMNIERWRIVDGYEGEYWVSSFGRVCSLKGRYPVILKCGVSAGYPFVNLLLGGSQKSVKVHRLVAEAFIENTGSLQTVNHIDGNKQNNRASNLEWATYGDNNLHAHYSGLKGQVIAVLAIPNHSGVGYYFPSMAATKSMGFNQSHVSAVCAGKKKSHHGFRWEIVSPDMELTHETQTNDPAAPPAPGTGSLAA